MTTRQMRRRHTLRLSSLLWVGGLTALACVCANSVIRAIAVNAFHVSPAFQPLQPPTVIVSTVIYLALAIGALLLVSRVSQRPARAYRLLACACLLLSLLAPLMALTGALPTPGMNERIFWVMVAMHITSAALVIALLPLALSHRQAEGPRAATSAIGDRGAPSGARQ